MSYLVIVVTAIVTSAATQGAIWLKDQWSWNRSSRFSALYAALFFEAYASSCARQAGELQAFDSSDGHAGLEHTSVPTMPEFPAEIDWQRLGIGLTEPSHGLRVEVDATNAYIADAYSFDPPDGGDGRVRQATVRLGIAALDLADRIRKAGKLSPPVEADEQFSTRSYLVERHERLIAMQKENEERMRVSRLARERLLAEPSSGEGAVST